MLINLRYKYETVPSELTSLLGQHDIFMDEDFNEIQSWRLHLSDTLIASLIEEETIEQLPQMTEGEETNIPSFLLNNVKTFIHEYEKYMAVEITSSELDADNVKTKETLVPLEVPLSEYELEILNKTGENRSLFDDHRVTVKELGKAILICIDMRKVSGYRLNRILYAAKDYQTEKEYFAINITNNAPNLAKLGISRYNDLNDDTVVESWHWHNLPQLDVNTSVRINNHGKRLLLFINVPTDREYLILQRIEIIESLGSMKSNSVNYILYEAKRALANSTTAYSSIIETINDLQKSLTVNLEKKIRFSQHIETLTNKLRNASINTEEFFRNILVNKEIESFSLSDESFIFTTRILVTVNPMSKIKQIAGKFVCTYSKRSGFRFINEFGTIGSNYGYHIGQEGQPCFGNIAGDVSKLVAEKKLDELIPLLISFLKSSLLDDAWGGRTWGYPIYPLQTITDEQDKIHTRYTKDIQLSRTGLWGLLDTESFINLYQTQYDIGQELEQFQKPLDIWKYRKD